MICGKKLPLLCLPTNAATTLKQTVQELPEEIDIRILVDDHSLDATADLSRNWA